MSLDDLKVLVPQYASNKAELDSYKKICDKENAQIKAIMKDFALQHYETDEYKAVYSVSQRESMNEEMLLEIAHIHGIPEIVKTKEYIDYDALEKLIYDNKVSSEVLREMDKARETKEVVSLRVTKLKGKKND